jgi:rhodanese-related sulfurtransferase
MSSDSSSTIEKERRLNYALQPKSREQFVALLTAEMPARPAYFQSEVARNRSGAVALEQLPPVSRLSPEEVIELQTQGAVVLDTRPAEQFGAAHLPGSLHIPLSGQFASWAARLLGTDATLVLVAENDADVEEARMRLARVGIEKIAGALGGGILAWIDAGKSIRSVDQISAQDAAEWLKAEPGRYTILDVREKAERAAGGSIPGSVSIPLAVLEERVGELDRNQEIFVHCRSGYRSSIASSILDSAGFTQLANIVGGYDAWALIPPAEVNAPAASCGRS